MSKALLAVVGLAAVGGLVIATNQPTTELRALRAVKAQNAGEVHGWSFANGISEQAGAALRAIAQTFPTQEDVLQGFAVALSFAGGINNEWLNAFVKIGRYDLATELSRIQLGVTQ